MGGGGGVGLDFGFLGDVRASIFKAKLCQNPKIFHYFLKNYHGRWEKNGYFNKFSNFGVRKA